MTPTIHADVMFVTIAARDRMSDLVLPARLPLAEILPEVAVHLRLLDAYEAHTGYALTEAGGTVLDLDAGLLEQGVLEGAVLTLEPGVRPPSPKVYDDVAEAVADFVEALDGGWTARWTPEHSRVATLVVAALLSLVGAVALARQPAGDTVVTAVELLGSMSLLALAYVFAWGRRDVGAALPLIVGGAWYASVAATTGMTGHSNVRLAALAAMVAAPLLLVVSGLARARRR